MRNKVFVDANVLVSASICLMIKELNIEFKHHFHVISEPLLAFFSKNVSKRIGFFTDLIENTCSNVLSDAIDDEIKGYRDKNPNINQAQLLTAFSFILSESIRQLRYNMSLLIREPVDGYTVMENKDLVIRFYDELRELIAQKNPSAEIEEKMKSVPRKFERAMTFVYKFQDSEEMKAYSKLRKKFIESPPNMNDIEILAQAIYFKDIFSKEEATNLILVSTDQHFSKITLSKSNLAKIVPENIKKKFNIICDWPDEVLSMIK